MSSINNHLSTQTSRAFDASQDVDPVRFAADPDYAAQMFARLMSASDTMASDPSSQSSQRTSSVPASPVAPAPTPLPPPAEQAIAATTAAQTPAAVPPFSPAPIRRKPVARKPVNEQATVTPQRKPVPVNDSAAGPSTLAQLRTDVVAPEPEAEAKAKPAPQPSPEAAQPEPPSPLPPQQPAVPQLWDNAPMLDFNPQSRVAWTGVDPNLRTDDETPYNQHLMPRFIVMPKLLNERPVGGGIALPKKGHEWPNLSENNPRNWQTEAESRKYPKVLRQINPIEFCMPPRQPEILFKDAIGVPVPGVAQTKQCDRGGEHDVLRFNFADWPEYNTKLASHGLSYEDYFRMSTGAQEILQRAPFEFDAFYAKQTAAWGVCTGGLTLLSVGAHREGGFSKGFLKGHRGTERDLKNFFYDVSENLRARGVPVVVKFKSTSREKSYWRDFDILVRHQALHIPMRRENAATYYVNTF